MKEGPHYKREVRSSWFANAEDREAALSHQSLNMKVCHTLICFIILTHQGGNIGLVKAEIHISRGKEGEKFTVGCQLSSALFGGSRRRFCRKTCANGDVLIDTSDDTAQNGRYSIKYEKKDILSSDILYVTITQLNKSDAGRYRCHLDKTLAPDSYYDFEIVVTEASTTSKPNRTLRPFSASTFVPSASRPPSLPAAAATTTQPRPSTHTSHFCSDSPETSTHHLTSSAGLDPSYLLCYVGGILAALIIFLSAALLIFYKKKRGTNPKGPPMEMEYADITDARCVYEEVREGDRPSSSPPVEVSTLYTMAKCSQTDGVESSDEYSLAISPQNKAEDSLNELNYSVVDLSHKAETNSAPCGNVDDTVYSTPLVDTSSASNTKDASLPLYSYLEKQQ